jgi:hypothetical protein
VRILVVEGDMDQICCLRKRLILIGHEVLGARDRRWGLRVWKNFRPFDLIVSEFVFAKERSFINGPKIENVLELVAAIRAVEPLQRFILQTSGENLTVPFSVKLLKKPYAFRRLAKLLEPSPQMTLPLESED